MTELEKLADDMFTTLLGLSVIAEDQVIDICADIQEGGIWTPEKKMELRRWEDVQRMIDRYTQWQLTR